MTENTKKWLTVAGCLVVCAILVAVIASSFSKDKVTDDLQIGRASCRERV